jgi:ABC-2 type transport system permease protein
MKTLAFYLKIYSRLIKQSIKVKMSFKLDFLISSIGIIFVNLTTLFSFVYLFDQITGIGGLNYYEVIFVYSFFLIAISPQQIFFDNIWNIWVHFIEGSFIKYCLRPIDSMFYYLTESIDLKGIPQLGLGIALMVYSGTNLSITWNIMSVLILVILIFNAACIYSSIMIIAAATGFWITDPFEIISFVNRSKDFGKYPATIYNKYIKAIITFILPFGFISYYPSEYFISNMFSPISIFTIPAAIIFFLLARKIWASGLKRFVPTGS